MERLDSHHNEVVHRNRRLVEATDALSGIREILIRIDRLKEELNFVSLRAGEVSSHIAYEMDLHFDDLAAVTDDLEGA